MKRNKTLWIINQYASSPDTGIGGRHYHLARELAQRGVKVYLIAAGFHHLLRQPRDMTEPYEVESDGNFNMVWIKTPTYTDAHSKKRVWNWFLFGWRLLRLKSIINDPPDFILISSPPLVSFLAAERLAKHYHSRLVFEVRDIWPLTLTVVGGLSSSHPLIRFMQWIEDRAYQKSDRVVSNLKYSVRHMQSRGMPSEKFAWVPNGFSLNEVQTLSPLSQECLAQLPESGFVVGYTGTIGVANALDILLLAAKYLTKYPDIKFVLVGAGKEKSRLEKLAQDEAIDNVVFIDAVTKTQVQSALKVFDACYIGWRDDSLYEFGIAANKIFDYLYSAKPIIHSFSGNGDLVQEYKAGITVPAEDHVAVSEAVLKLYKLKEEEREAMGQKGHESVIEHHEYGKLANQLKSVLFEEQHAGD